MVEPEKRTIEIKAKNKGMFLSPWVNNDPTIPENATYWLVDEVTDLPTIVDPVPLEQIDAMLNDLPDKVPGEDQRDPDYGDGTEA
ncbi:MAG: hypothetical protein ABI705_01100 [Aestuariivirga sp.]